MASTMRPMLSPTYGEQKWNKRQELNSSMSITPSSPDAYERTTKTLNRGGTSNNG